MKKLAVVIPTYNEKENIPILIKILDELLKDIDNEIIVVDDNSPDKTWEVAENLRKDFPQVKNLRRIGRKGLSSAVIEGIMISESEYVVVMDADLQHDEQILPEMLEEAEKGVDVVIGSRYTGGGSTGDWNKKRLTISKTATNITTFLFKHKITDPMSGFFLIKREVFIKCVENLEGRGFKILLDILSNFKPDEVKIKEVPYTFKTRLHGESKLSPSVAIQFLEFLYNKKIGKYIPLRFFKFALVGTFGALFHFLILSICYKAINFTYNTSLLIAIESAITINFILNNIWTFKDKTLKGLRIIIGYIKYNIFAWIGGGLNFIVSNYLIDINLHWILASLIGALAGILWNYVLNKMLTWKDI